LLAPSALAPGVLSEGVLKRLVKQCRLAAFTGAVEVNAVGHLGAVWLRSGRVTDAEFAGFRGKEAAVVLLALTQGEYVLRPALPAVPGARFADGALQIPGGILPLVELMRQCEVGGMSCEIVVRGSAGKGLVSYRGGTLVRAVYNGSEDDDMIFDLLNLVDASYSVYPDVPHSLREPEVSAAPAAEESALLTAEVFALPPAGAPAAQEMALTAGAAPAPGAAPAGEMAPQPVPLDAATGATPASSAAAGPLAPLPVAPAPAQPVLQATAGALVPVPPGTLLPMAYAVPAAALAAAVEAAERPPAAATGAVAQEAGLSAAAHSPATAAVAAPEGGAAVPAPAAAPEPAAVAGASAAPVLAPQPAASIAAPAQADPIVAQPVLAAPPLAVVAQEVEAPSIPGTRGPVAAQEPPLAAEGAGETPAAVSAMAPTVPAPATPVVALEPVMAASALVPVVEPGAASSELETPAAVVPAQASREPGAAISAAVVQSAAAGEKGSQGSTGASAVASPARGEPRRNPRQYARASTLTPIEVEDVLVPCFRPHARVAWQLRSAWQRLLRRAA
jgi:hypothetical protein